MLEAAGFDFRNRHPQRLVIKLCKIYNVRKQTVGRTAYRMGLDLYRTFAPLKQTAPAMALACIELAVRLCGERVDEVEQGGELYDRWKVGRAEVMGMVVDSPPSLNPPWYAWRTDNILQRLCLILLIYTLTIEVRQLWDHAILQTTSSLFE